MTQEKAILGKLLFWEEQLSTNNRVACGTCHRPESGGGDPRRAMHPGPDGVTPSSDDTFGSPGLIASDAANDYQPSPLFGLREQVTPRAAPSVLTAAWFPRLFWDGRASGQFVDPQSGGVSLPAGAALESQAVAPPVSSVEMAHELRNWTQIAAKLQHAESLGFATNLPPDMAAAAASDYPALFRAAFGDPAITAERIAMAIATYERTLAPDDTPWDRFKRGAASAMTPAQIDGMNVFNGAGRCSLCHTPGLFSDGSFRNLGLRPIADDPGRQTATGSAADRGRFKVPSLRNVGLRASFMHTGEFTSLSQVVDFYVAGGGSHLDNKDPLLAPLALSPQQRADLVDFLSNALTDPRVANRLPPFDRPTLTGERIPLQGFQFGAGSPGSGGIVPEILAEYPAKVPSRFKVGIANALGGAVAGLLVVDAPSPPGTTVLGVNVNVQLPEVRSVVIVTSGAPGVAGAGYGTVHHDMPNYPWLIGTTWVVQWITLDPGVPNGLASSRGAELRYF